MFAPAEATTLPVSPTIAFATEDQYYNGKRQSRARPMAITATIEGKPVSIRTRDAKTPDGVIRFVTVRSTATGKLAIWTRDPLTKQKVIAAEYAIARDALRPTATTAAVRRAYDTRLSYYYHVGSQVAVRVDAPAIAFLMKWRHGTGGWRQLSIPATIDGDHSEARVGSTICGFSENLPADALDDGVEAKLTATLPDGTSIPVTQVPERLALPPADPEELRGARGY